MSIDMTYDRQKAIEAQKQFCKEHECFHPAPRDGYCEHCGRDIYGEGGISVEEAGKRLISGCPICHHTLVD